MLFSNDKPYYSPINVLLFTLLKNQTKWNYSSRKTMSNMCILAHSYSKPLEELFEQKLITQLLSHCRM